MEATNNVNEFPGNVVDDSKNEKSIEVIDTILDSLYNIRLSLISMKIRGETRIEKSRFKTMLDNEKTKSLEVGKAIDDLFSNLFEQKEEKPLSLQEMIDSVEGSINQPSQSKVLTKTLPYYEHSTDDSNNIAA